ncbi:MAG: hypothetical protein E5W65_25910 [Mesorhizobium sp.]|uniref:hypothetical protein n=1 Tax=Mesorhizobium sp. TaxID=1871066 RepID=UPI00120A8BDE|nr:hypothetical protein [Mesorhizobium sp.]TIT32215.1 MAG: hypothetical protein E5W65_25910 [Mesorhizobium sp.]
MIKADADVSSQRFNITFPHVFDSINVGRTTVRVKPLFLLSISGQTTPAGSAEITPVLEPELSVAIKKPLRFDHNAKLTLAWLRRA